MSITDQQKKMDQTLEDTFPASDPPSWSTPRKENGKAREADKSGQNYTKDDYLKR